MSDKELTVSEPSNFRVCLLGSEGAGKTCFVAGLAVLGEPNHATPLNVRATDTLTVKYIDELRTSLRSAQWPPGTTVTKILKIRVSLDSFCIDVRVADYKGEDFRSALKQLEYDKIQELHEHYAKSDVLILLFDPLIDLQNTSGDHEAQQVAANRLDAHLQAISQQWQSQSHDHTKEPKIRTDIAVVITKCDLVPNLRNSEQARDYFRQHAQHLDLKIRQLAGKVEYFPLSSIGLGNEIPSDLGQQGNRRPPTNLSPYGYEELFRWVIRRRRMRVWSPLLNKLTIGSVAATVVIVILLALWWGWQYETNRQARLVLEDENLPLNQKLEETKDIQDLSNRELRITLLSKREDEIEAKIRNANSVEILKETQKEIAEILEANPGGLTSRFEELAKLVSTRSEELLFASCQNAFDQKTSNFPDLATQFLDQFPGSSKASEVRNWLQQLKIADYTKRRLQIRNMLIKDSSKLEGKIRSINEFLEQFGDQIDANEKPKIIRAAELGKQFLVGRTYTCKLKRTGGFEAPRTQGIELLVNERVCNTHWSDSASKEVLWENERFIFDWKAGDTIDIRLLAANWRNATDKVATINVRDPLAIQVLAKKSLFQYVTADWRNYVNLPFVEFTLDELSSDDLRIIDSYLSPGDAW